jgi:membrane protein DedA with SNARE-associated domain
VVFFICCAKEIEQLDINNLEYWIINTLQALFDQFGWWGIVGMMLFENATGITPSEIILGMAGWFLVSRHDLPLSFIFLGGFYAAIGSVLGASLAYWVARIGGRPIVDKIASWFRVPAHQIYRAEKQFHRWGPGLVFLGRMVPGIRTLISIPAGLARMPFGRFFLATFLGAYAWCTLLIGVGFWLGEEWEQISWLVKQYTLPLVATGLLVAVLLWLFQRFGWNHLISYLKRNQWINDNE